MRFFLFAIGGLLSVVAQRPAVDDKPGTARWILNQVKWGVLATTNIRLNGTAFGNPVSVTDAMMDGTPYFYVSMMDESIEDLQEHPQCTLSLSEASLDCAALKLDPEDPRCSRLSLTGTMVNVTDQTEHDKAKEVLFSQHPSMKSWPADHGWLIQKLKIDKIWLIDTFGGASDISVKDYVAAKAPARGTPADPSHKPNTSQPFFTKKAETARWLIHEVTWGTLATTSVHLKGLPFGNPVSLVDGTSDNATGTPYFAVSPLDASIQDIAKYPEFSLTVSQAEVDCGLHGISGAYDPEDPRCTRLTYSGTMVKVTDAVELDFAKKGLIQQHPEVKDWLDMGSHDFFVAKMNIEHIWLIDFFGGADDISPTEYYKAKEAAKHFAEKATVSLIV